MSATRSLSRTPNGTWTRETTFAYDALGREVKHTLPLGQSETWAYDALGRLESHTDFLGQKAAYDYDALGRVQHKSLYAAPDPYQWPPDPNPAPAKTVTYAYDQYDAGGNRHDTTTIGSAVTDDAYDREGRLIAITSPEGTVRYSYDPATGQKTRVWTGSDPNAPVTDLTYAYDEFGRLTTVQAVRLDAAAVALTTTYAYDAADRLTVTTRPNGTTEARTYDDLNRLKSITTALTNNPGQVLAGFTYTLDPAGHRIAADEANGRHVAYTYDADGRLTREAITGDHTVDYAYDLAGNRATKHDSAAPQMQQDISYGSDDNGRMTSASSGYSWTQYTYDDNGALISTSGSESASYTYDLEGRLTHANVGGHAIDYTYDDAGNRTSQAVDGQKRTYLNDPNQAYDQVLEEYAPDGVLAATYVRGLDLLFQDRQGAKSYFLKDGLGSTRALTDAAGSVTDTYAYDAYGVTIAHTGSTVNSYMFAGEQRDAATGLDYLRARYNDTAAGRFTSRDTNEGNTENPITINHYLYANANPIDVIDPSGHEGLVSTMVSVGIQGLFNGIRLGVIGAVSGGGLGAIDAALGGQDIIQGAIGGAKWGAGIGFGVGFLGPFATTFLAPATITALLNMGAGASLALGAYGGASSFADGNYLQGIYRVALGTLGYYSLRSAATAPLKPVNIGGEGEIPDVINLQPRSALGATFGRATDGKSLAGMIREGIQFLIYNANTGKLPFQTGTVPKVITNSVPIDTPPGGLFPPITSTEIIRVLKPGGQWIRDGVVFFTKPG